MCDGGVVTACCVGQNSRTDLLLARLTTSAARKHCYKLSLSCPTRLSCALRSLLSRFDTSMSC